MKILIIQDYLRSGGTERQTLLLANGFRGAGHDAAVLTFRPGGPLAATLRAVPHTSLQPLDLKLDWFAPRLTRTVRRFEPDIILCMGRMANCYAGRLTDRVQARVIGTMRTGKPLPRLFRQSLQRVHHIVANSADAKNHLVTAHALGAERISVIHNSLVFPPVSASVRDESFRASLGASPSTTVLLCVAMFRPEKNQRELVEIAAQLPAEHDWQLWLAGDGPARAACEQLVARRNLAGRVKFLGFLRDPSRLYAAADVAVHASWSESLSNFLIEAQAHGLPVVAYEAQGIRECFVPGATGWEIARDDRAAFVAAVARLAAASASERAALSVAAQHFARETFDPGRQVAAYLELFERLAATRQP